MLFLASTLFVSSERLFTASISPAPFPSSQINFTYFPENADASGKSEVPVTTSALHFKELLDVELRLFPCESEAYAIWRYCDCHSCPSITSKSNTVSSVYVKRYVFTLPVVL